MLLLVSQSPSQMLCDSYHNSHVVFLYGVTWFEILDVHIVLGAGDVRAFGFTESRDMVFYNPFHELTVSSYCKDQGCALKVLF